MNQKKNVLFILVDEKAFPFVYESAALAQWRQEYLQSEAFLRTNCMEMLKHYAGSTACCPSRATLFTGQYPPLHGVTQTNGVAKRSIDPNMPWLDQNTAPTIGDIFKANGYKTFWKGKWHMSFEDLLVPGTTTESIVSYDPTTGIPDPTYNSYYLKANRLEKYGFDGWVGPEPFGVSPNNTGQISRTQTGGRDPIYSQEAINILNELKCCPIPWLLVLSLVNPHDIVFYGSYTANLPGLNFELDTTLPTIPPPPSFDEDLSTKPSAQASYRIVYDEMLQPISDQQTYRQLYMTLQKKVDDQIYAVLQALKSNQRMYENTLVVFTSDHGDLMGAHGGMSEKWHNMYEESIHVPFLIHNPKYFTQYHSTSNTTSHVDVIPTLASLVGIDLNATISCLNNDNFVDAKNLVGKTMYMEFDTSVNYQYDTTRLTEPLYFYTIDNPSSGLYQVNALTKKPYSSVVQPNGVEAIITYYNGDLYKYAIYFDPTNPNTPNEYEMYNLTSDPYEMTNLAYSGNSTTATQTIQGALNVLLLQQRAIKKIVPNNLTNPLPPALQ